MNRLPRRRKPAIKGHAQAAPKLELPAAARKRKPHRVTLGDRVITTHGLPRSFWQDIYHICMTASWPMFFITVAGIFLTVNALFAGFYLLGDRAISNVSPSGFLGLFFFSVETLATVGYGDMHPQTLYGHLVATVEIFTGTISIAVITGVMFARFSRPRARIIASRHPIVRPFDGMQTLMIRAANARQNVIVDASAKLRMILAEVTAEGVPIRRLYDLKLVRDQHPILLLGWNIMHVIDESSPLFGHTAETLEQGDAGFILTIDGLDETTAQNMQSRFMYTHDAMRWNHVYVDMLSVDEDGGNYMDFSKFHDVLPL
jgi:inward rectifier potassium channel